MLKEIVADEKMVAFCGLYCGACKAFLKGKCPGCHENEKATWCKIRSCCTENSFRSCADCTQYDDPRDCGKFNNMISKIFAFLFQSNRYACVQAISDKGYEEYARFMTDLGRQSIKR